MSYIFYIRHKTHAVEWKLIAMIIKTEKLIDKLDRSKGHPLVRKFILVPICKL